MSLRGKLTVGSGPDRSANRTIVIAKPGAGKTHLVSSIVGSNGRPIFMIPVEDGLKGINPNANPEYFKVNDTPYVPRSFQDVLEMLEMFMVEINIPPPGGGPRPFMHVGIDSLTGLDDLVLKHTLGVEKIPHMDAKEYKQAWEAARPHWQRIRDWFDQMKRHGVNIWITAHAVDAIDADTQSGETFRKQDLALRGSGAKLQELRLFWKGWADNVFFLDRPVTVRKGNKDRRAVAQYRAGRLLYTSAMPICDCKSRLPLPSEIEASWSSLEREIRKAYEVAKRPATGPLADRLRAEIEDALRYVEADVADEQRDSLTGVKTYAQLVEVHTRVLGLASIAKGQEEGQPDEDQEPESDKPTSSKKSATAEN